jgi:hypothetical protein
MRAGFLKALGKITAQLDIFWLQRHGQVGGFQGRSFIAQGRFGAAEQLGAVAVVGRGLTG